MWKAHWTAAARVETSATAHVETLLATGEGVPHKRYPNRYFRKGEPVKLDEDMTELRAAANRFLLPEDDPGHGWCLDHPIGKMGIFQAYLHAKGKK